MVVVNVTCNRASYELQRCRILLCAADVLKFCLSFYLILTQKNFPVKNFTHVSYIPFALSFFR